MFSFSELTNYLGAVQWTNYLIDIIVALCLIGFVIICARRGFIDCLFGFASTLIALFVALLLAKTVLKLTGGLFGLQGALEKGCENVLDGIKGFNMDISGQNLEEALENKTLPGFLVSLVVKQFSGKDLAPGTTLAVLVGDVLARLIALFLTGLLLFFITKLLLRIVRKIFNKVADSISLIGAVNTLLGAAIGLAQGILVLYAVLSLLALIPSESITKYLDNSIFVGLMYKYNPVNYLLGWLIG